MYKWARRSAGGYEVSSRGDKRFSALYAKLKSGLTVETTYQCAKGTGKGLPAKDPNFDYWGNYLSIWIQWAEENPELIEELREIVKTHNNTLTDMFASTDNNQARALCFILNSKVLETPAH